MEIEHSTYENVGIASDPLMLESVRQESLSDLRRKAADLGWEIIPGSESVKHWIGVKRFLAYGPETCVLYTRSTAQVKDKE